MRDSQIDKLEDLRRRAEALYGDTQNIALARECLALAEEAEAENERLRHLLDHIATSPAVIPGGVLRQLAANPDKWAGVD